MLLSLPDLPPVVRLKCQGPSCKEHAPLLPGSPACAPPWMPSGALRGTLEIASGLLRAAVPPGAGTVVDHSVTHPTEYDWYLNSHAGTQGTSKSAHYHVLHDDTRMPIDELQAFTYHTTYLYCRHEYP